LTKVCYTTFMKVVLMHGKDTDPTQKWYPWFAKEVKNFLMDFFAPALPDSSDPSIDKWIAELEKTNPDEDTILVGHSRGGVTILRWLEELPINRRVQKVILIGTNSGNSEKMIGTENSKGFFTKEGYDFKKIKLHCNNFVVLHSRDDEWVPFQAGEENAKGLNAKFLKFDNRGHFGKKVSTIPELLREIN